jgi:hypothetical protein
MKKPSPYATLSAFSLMAMSELGVFDNHARQEEPTAPPKKCLLPGCDKLREGNKLFCSREHFGEYSKNRKK